MMLERKNLTRPFDDTMRERPNRGLSPIIFNRGLSPIILEAVKGLEPMAADIYRYLSFDQIAEYREVAEKVIPIRAA